VMMAILSITMFLGITLLGQSYHVLPSEQETVVSQLARGVFGGRGLPYYAVQAATMLILVLAANTASADAATEQMQERWKQWGDGVTLVLLDSPFRSLMEPLLEYIEQVDAEHPNDYVTIVLPEFVPARWWHHLFHNQRALMIRGALLFKPNTVFTSVPFHLRH
jgi:hypothetical protein